MVGTFLRTVLAMTAAGGLALRLINPSVAVRIVGRTMCLPAWIIQADRDLVALGVSAIGPMGPTYRQNAKYLIAYHDALPQGEFFVARRHHAV
jgi:hypothetical protein